MYIKTMEILEREVKGLVLLTAVADQHTAIKNSILHCGSLIDQNVPHKVLQEQIPFIELLKVALFNEGIAEDYFYILNQTDRVLGVCEILYFNSETLRIYINDIEFIRLDEPTYRKILTNNLPISF